MPSSKYKPVTLRPLTGIFDARSNVDETPPGAFRWKQDFQINPDGKLARAKGWRRFGDPICPTNEDWHNQHIDSDGLDHKEPMTILFPSTSTEGRRRLFGGTKTRLMVLDEAAGDWITLARDMAAADTSASLTQRRFNMAELEDKVYFTNDLDLPGYFLLSNLGAGAQYSPQLATAGENDAGAAVALTKAHRVISWNDVIIYMNTVEGGVRRSNRIRWSDLKDGTKLEVGNPADSIADFQDIDYGHVLLNAVPIGTALYLFTDRSIWRANFAESGGDAVLDVVRVSYDPENQAKCLAYENSLTSDGDTAWYLGRDGIYSYKPGYSSEPQLKEWLHRSTSIIFSGTKAIDTAACNSPVSKFDKTNNELHFSWPIWNRPRSRWTRPTWTAPLTSLPRANLGPASTGIRWW